MLLCLVMCVLSGCGGYRGTNRLEPVRVQQEVPDISMEHSYYAKNDSLFLLFKFEDVQQVLDILQSTSSYEYAVRAGLSERDAALLQDSIDMPDRKITDVEGQLHLQMGLPARVVQEPNVLHLQVWQVLSGQERMGVRFKVPLRQEMMQKDFRLVHAKSGKPLFQNFITTSDKLLARQYGNGDSLLRVERFELDFRPAPPPMSMQKPPVPRTISAVSSRTVGPSDTLRFTEEGLYLFKPGSASSQGVLALSGNYPQITKAEELIPPLIYLTTSQEREALLQADDPKAAVDNFWLQVGGSERRGRELIRTYYSRVEMANKLFTAHKAGWATDRGMIYLIYGRPSSVSEVGPNITWVYRESETAPYIKFVFTKKENNFTENYYELIRRREYEDSWYSTVAKWRAGKTNL